MLKIVKREDHRYDPLLFNTIGKFICALEAGSGNARKGFFANLQHFQGAFFGRVL